MIHIRLFILAAVIFWPVSGAMAQFSILEQEDNRDWQTPALPVSELSCDDLLRLLAQAQRDIAERNISHPDMTLAASLTSRAGERFNSHPLDGLCRQDAGEALQLYRGMVGLY